MRIAAVLLCLTLAACATTAPQSPAQTVYSIESGYAAALTVAVAYKALPPCAPGAPKICSDTKVVAQLQRADDVAYAALSAAQAIVRTPNAGANADTAIAVAREAVTALASITATLTTR